MRRAKVGERYNNYFFVFYSVLFDAKELVRYCLNVESRESGSRVARSTLVHPAMN